MRQARVLVVGYLSIDTVTDTQGRTSTAPGGAALYAALGARRAGARVDIAASVGPDYPQAWLAAMDAEGVGRRHVRGLDARTRWADIRHRADGSRVSAHFEDPDWHRSSDIHAPVWPAALAGYGRVVACPMPVGVLGILLKDAEAAGVPVIADTNEAFAGSDPAALGSLLGRLDVFAPSREETRLLRPELDDAAAARDLARTGAAVVQKLGAGGIRVVEPGGAEWNFPAAETVVVDPTGAGDATVGALAAGRAAGLVLRDAALAALRVGALAVSQNGPAALGAAFATVAQDGATAGVHQR